MLTIQLSRNYSNAPFLFFRSFLQSCCNTFLSFENGFQSQKSKIDDDVKLYIKLLENEIIKLEDSMKDK